MMTKEECLSALEALIVKDSARYLKGEYRLGSDLIHLSMVSDGKLVLSKIKAADISFVKSSRLITCVRTYTRVRTGSIKALLPVNWEGDLRGRLDILNAVRYYCDLPRINTVREG